MKKRTVKDFIALYAPEDEEKLVLIQDGVSADKTFLDTYLSLIHICQTNTIPYENNTKRLLFVDLV